MIKSYRNLDDMFADIGDRIEAGKEAAKNHHIKVEDLKQGDYFTYLHPEGIAIFGEVVETTGYPEDAVAIAMARENGYIFAHCYSSILPEGELGDVHVTRIEHKITREIFDRAKSNGFRHLYQLN